MAQPQSIQFAPPPALFVHGTATVSATATSGLPVSYSSLTPSVCMVDSSTGLVTSLAVGSCIIAADQAGNADFAPATQVTQSIDTAYDPNQTITPGPLPALVQYGTAFIAATATSGLPVSYSSLTPSVCTVDSSTGLVTSLAAGTCTLTASQPGDTYYHAAPPVTLTLTIPTWTGPITVPDPPRNVGASLDNPANGVLVSFSPPAQSGGSPITGYQVSSTPAGLSASGSSSPIRVACPTAGCPGYTLQVQALNSAGSSLPSTSVHILTPYRVSATIYEPDTQPNNTLFDGTFVLDSSSQTVQQLQGELTESMIGPPMPTVHLGYQLSSVPDGASGLLVSAFALPTTQVFAEGGFAASSSAGFYYGWPSAPNPASGGTGNSFITVYIPLPDPAVPLTPTQISRIAYGDCAAGGMMGDTCMTGHSSIGTMGGYPVAQVISRP
ncbi:MAG: hypothetical protein Fur0040_10250 [Sideroxydans sp.]